MTDGIALACVVLTAVNVGITLLSFFLLHRWQKFFAKSKKKSLFN